jgi:integrase/recombinase XerC
MARRLPSTQSPTRRRPRPPADVGIDQELALVLTGWRADGLHSEQTLTRMGETAIRFTARLKALGVTTFTDVAAHEAAGFVHAPTGHGTTPDVATQHFRRTAVRTLYRSLRRAGYPVGDPTLDLVLPAKGLLAARPLTDDEVTLCRATVQLTAGRGAPLRVAAWALGEATAVSSEITAITLADLDDPIAPSAVRLPGTRRHDPRMAELTPWGATALTAHAARLRAGGAGPGTLLAYGGAALPGGAKAQASICNALREVLHTAGLSAEPDVRPASLRHWAARTAYDAGRPIQDVARLLGLRSLDAAAEDIALTWRTPTALTGTENRA